MVKAKLARFLMKLMEVTPNEQDPTLRERFNLNAFASGSDDERRQFFLAIARDRHASECEMHIHHYLGLSHERMQRLLRGRTVMELGCYVGGSVAAHAEAYGIGLTYGVDIDDSFILAAQMFTQGRPERFCFLKGRGEEIPLPSEACDAIITQDTLEHVDDVESTLQECRRVLRPGGLLFCVFPSFYHPWGNHLGMVTAFPWLHLLFADSIVEKAYRAIIHERGDAAYWYRPGNRMEMKRGRFHGVNGLTARRFRDFSRRLDFPVVHWNVAPIFSVGRKVQRNPWLRLLALPLRPLAILPGLEELLLHRVCCVLQKPPVSWNSDTTAD